MSLQFKITAEEQKNSFIIFDCTGIYRYDNLCGWNAPNPDIRKVTSCTAEIWNPNSSRTLPGFPVDLTGKFPNPEFNGIEILPYQCGIANNQLESGKYTIKVSIVGLDKKGNEYTETYTINRIFVNNVTCCIDKQLKNVNKDAFKDIKQQYIVEMNELLVSANHAIECELYENAEEIINLLKSQCACNDC